MNFVNKIGLISSLLLWLSALTLFAQNKFGIGISVEPLLCFTGLGNGPETLQKTSTKYWDLFNYSVGVRMEYQLEAGLGMTTGINFLRKRFGFIHEEMLDDHSVSLWGHSEYHSISLPLYISHVIVTSRQPFYEIAPVLGISVGGDFSSYRNLTRLDTCYGYAYEFDRENYMKNSVVTTAHAGLVFKTIIDQLGVMHWRIMLSKDLTGLPDFNYAVISGINRRDFNQQIKMNYISVSMTYYFNTWEVFEGKFLRRNY